MSNNVSIAPKDSYPANGTFIIKYGDGKSIRDHLCHGCFFAEPATLEYVDAFGKKHHEPITVKLFAWDIVEDVRQQMINKTYTLMGEAVPPQPKK